jgi:glutamate-1-semialdehyde 2,1-aminomutase
VAAVVMEAVLCNSGCLMPRPGYLEAARELTRRHGALLLFDEVITGFRIDTGGAQRRFGVTPDCATFGKAVGGGMPLSVTAGRKEIVEQIAGGGVVFGGSFNGNPLTLAGANACLEELACQDGAALSHAGAMGEKIRAGLKSLGERHHVPLQTTGFGAAFSVHFTTRTELSNYRDTLADDAERRKRFLYGAMEEGVILVPDGRMYVSAVHTEQDVAETLEGFARVFARL